MGARKRKSNGGFEDSVGRVIQAVRKLKDKVTGVRVQRLHRVESELMTIKGQKRARRTNQEKRDRARGKKPSAK